MTPSPLPVDPLAAVEHDIETVGDLPVDEQAAVFTAVHRALTDALAQTAGPGGPATVH